MKDGDELPGDLREQPLFDRVKARRAARDPRRTGEECRAAPLTYEPRVERARCEGKAECVAVCPYAVFEVRRIDDDDFRARTTFLAMKVLYERYRGEQADKVV